eukprot:COSAG06_NODE_404_length_16134_cov_88.503336_6_plen_76_part_00
MFYVLNALEHSTTNNEMLFALFAELMRDFILGEIKRSFFGRHLYIKTNIYQDRLGTNIGKAQEREIVFPQGLSRG